MDALTVLLEAELFRVIEESRPALEAFGDLCVESGVLAWKGGRLDVHTDFGPPGQDKAVNEDFVLAWTGRGSLRWAIAMADGVGSSLASAVGAKLACWASLAELIRCDAPPSKRAYLAVSAAGTAIGGVADQVARDKEATRPSWEFPMSWAYKLREGIFLQTTLTLIWCDALLHFAVVGDGGIAMCRCRDEQDRAFEILTKASEETHRVHAIGPANRIPQAIDFLESREWSAFDRVVAFTDGVGRGAASGGQALVDVLTRENLSIAQNAAKEVILNLARDCPPDSADNMTLAVARKGHA